MSIITKYIDNLKEQLDLLPLDEIESLGNDFFNYGKIINNYLSAGMVVVRVMPFIWQMIISTEFLPNAHRQFGSLHSLQIHRFLPAWGMMSDMMLSFQSN